MPPVWKTRQRPDLAQLIRAWHRTRLGPPRAILYLRRTFNPGTLTAQQIGQSCFHGSITTRTWPIYLNGVLAGSASGYSTAYVSLPMIPQRDGRAIPNGTNVLAVSCHQSTGGQFIDVGISEEVLVANIFTVPNDVNRLLAAGCNEWNHCRGRHREWQQWNGERCHLERQWRDSMAA